MTRSVTQGRISGLTSVAGVVLGNLGNAIGAALGLAALFAVSSLAWSGGYFAGGSRAAPSASGWVSVQGEAALRLDLSENE